MSAETTPNLLTPSRVIDTSNIESLFDSPARNTRSSKIKKTTVVIPQPESQKSTQKRRPKIPTTENGEIDLAKVKMRDLIRGSPFGKPMKSLSEKSVIGNCF